MIRDLAVVVVLGFLLLLFWWSISDCLRGALA